MEKVYSRLDLIEEEISGYEYTGVVDSILTAFSKTRNVQLSLRLPSPSILRANVLCEDVTIIGDLEKAFKLSDLISLLYKEFLLEVRNGEGLDQLYDRVMVRTSSQPIIRTATHIYQEVNKRRLGTVRVKLERSDALRGEVLLDDMTGLYPDHGFTLEDLLELITIDYIHTLQLKPNRTNVRKLLQKLDVE